MEVQSFSKDGASSKAVGSRKSLIWVMRRSLAYDLVHKQNYTMHERPRTATLVREGQMQSRGSPLKGR